jgi:hypothetical protein
VVREMNFPEGFALAAIHPSPTVYNRGRFQQIAERFGPMSLRGASARWRGRPQKNVTNVTARQ